MDIDRRRRPRCNGAAGQASADLGLRRPQNDQLVPRESDHAAGLEVGAVRYIKLGEKGKWVRGALSQGILPFGYRAVDHVSCAQGNWKEVRGQLIGMGRTNGGVSQGLRELKDFYGLPDDTLWVTIADGHVWWTFADGPVLENDEVDPEAPTRFRRTRNAWCKTSLSGVPLAVRSLSSALTSTANYQMTICAIKQADYLLRKIRDEIDPLRAAADILKVETVALAAKMIQQLDWRDFETLVDLIFMRGGWQRISALGRIRPMLTLSSSSRSPARPHGFKSSLVRPNQSLRSTLTASSGMGAATASFSSAIAPPSRFQHPQTRGYISGPRSGLRAPRRRLDCWSGWSTTRPSPVAPADTRRTGAV
jgi:hypothetical protein